MTNLGNFTFSDKGYIYKEDFVDWDLISEIRIEAFNRNDYFFESIEIHIELNNKKYYYNIGDKGVYIFYNNLIKRYKELEGSMKSEIGIDFRIETIDILNYKKNTCG
jgi:hypothetical protein